MSKRIGVGLAAVAAGVLAIGGPDRATAQPKETTQPAKDVTATQAGKPKGPPFLYGYDLRVRPGGAKNFDPSTPRVGVEVYADEPTGTAVAISDTGFVAAVPAPKVGDDKSAKWLTGHDLQVRKAGETAFTQATKKHGVEAYVDAPSGRLLYVTESGGLVFSPAPVTSPADKGPKWHHALDMKVRPANDDGWEKAAKFGVEAFKDEGSGLLMYVSETGGVAVGPAPAAAPDKTKVRPPKHLFGLLLEVRKPDEKDFTDKTKKLSVEVSEDPNTGGLVFVSDSGSVAVAPMPAKLNLDAKGVNWKNGLTLVARKGGDKDWKAGKRYGVEVFEEPKTGYLIVASDTGAISVLPK